MIQTVSGLTQFPLTFPEFPDSTHWVRLTVASPTAPVALALNGEIFDTPENFFRTYTYDFSPAEISNATLTADFSDLVEFTRARSDEWRTPMDENGFSYTQGYRYPFVRQPAFACGWDWCYPMTPEKKFRSISFSFNTDTPLPLSNSRIIPFDFCIERVRCPYVLSANLDTVSVPFYVTLLTLTPASEYEISVLCEDREETVWVGALPNGTHEIALPMFEIEHPSLWYPYALGTPHLYPFEIRVREKGSSAFYTHLHPVGFRHIKMSKTPDLRFEINHCPMPILGANWIPVSPHLCEHDFAQNQRLLGLARDYNINTLRVWGGGDYASEDFYRRCDALGLLVWQDFPFACNLYPENDLLLREVECEIAQQLPLVFEHPSLLCMCGNNEVHSCYYEWLRDAQIPYFYGQKYFNSLLPDACETWNPQVPYLPGSPFNPVTESMPSDPAFGDRHAWQCYFGEGPAQKDFRHLADDPSKFISEFGFISPPFPQSLLPEQRTFEFLDSRSNYNIPLARLKRYIEQVYSSASTDFETFCYQGLHAQALMIEDCVSRWLLRGCNGVLLWHYNDIWVAPSWGMIDGAHRARPALSVLKKLFAPVKVLFETSADGCCVPRLFAPDSVIANLSVEMVHYRNSGRVHDAYIHSDSVFGAVVKKGAQIVAKNVWQVSLPRENSFPDARIKIVGIRKLNARCLSVQIDADRPCSCVIPILNTSLDFNVNTCEIFPSAIDVIPDVLNEIALSFASENDLEKAMALDVQLLTFYFA